ncbi:Alpha/beta hydrolase family protein [compost metagenome]
MFTVFQEYFRRHQPPALIIWGKYDPYYSINEAYCYKRDLPNASVHVIGGSHMVLETNFDEVVDLIRSYSHFIAESVLR